MPTSSALKEFAESPDRFTDLSPDVERFADERVCIIQGPFWGAATDIHVAPGDVDALVEEVRARVPAEKSLIWWMGPSCEPADLPERLKALGFVAPEDGSELLHALAMQREPPAGPAEVDVRTVSSYDDFVMGITVGWDAFALSEERRERERPHLPAMYETLDAAPRLFVAYLDGQPAGVGRSVYSDRGVFLIGGAVLPDARGRGVYRALVRARWNDAVARGTPGMVTEARPDTSYPILKRLGFEEVCLVRRLQDPR